MESFPLQTWRLPMEVATHGYASPQACDAADKVLLTPRCCKDSHFTLKICTLSNNTSYKLRTGPVCKLLMREAHTIAVLNIDLERDQSIHRARLSSYEVLEGHSRFVTMVYTSNCIGFGSQGFKDDPATTTQTNAIHIISSACIPRLSHVGLV